MANPQAENGHTDLANETVEALAKIRIPGEEMQILWVVIRKTYGWHKKTDLISLSQFEKMTGLKRPNVCRGLKSLVSKKILYSIKKDTRDVVEYGFNKDFDKWDYGIKKDTSIKKDKSPSINIDKPLVSKKIHTKETLTKEIKTPDKKTSGGEKEVLPKKPNLNAWGMWIDANRAFGRKDPLAVPKDLKAAKSILALLKSEDEFKKIIRRFLKDTDVFLIKNGHGISFLTSRVNQYLNPNAGTEEFCTPEEVAEILRKENEEWAKDQERRKAESPLKGLTPDQVAEKFKETMSRMMSNEPKLPEVVEDEPNRSGE